MKFTILKLRIALWSILAVVVLWLFYSAIVPSGKITYIKNFSRDSYFIQKLTPAERVEKPKSNSQKIIGDPVYFALRTPRRFNKANIEIKYKNNSDLPVIETGVLVDKTLWHYDMKPLENKIIDQLLPTWNVIQGGDTVLIQRNKKYNSIVDFLQNLPPRNEIALYNYNLYKEYLLPVYKASNTENIINYTLRGPYQFYTYIKNEELVFKFSAVDLNSNKDSDPIDINLYYRNQIIASKHLNDDGLTGEINKKSIERTLDLNFDNLPTGVYKIEVKVNDDIITKNIKTRQSKLAFINKIWVTDENKKNVVLYTDGNKISAQTINPAKLQIIKINQEQLGLAETYKQFDYYQVSTNTKKIILAEDDVILTGEGVFSFAPEQLINPDFKKVNTRTKVNSLDVNYILATYQSPKQAGEWKISAAEIDLSNAYREFNKYSFIISVPGLKADDNIDDLIEIKEIKAELVGTNLWGKTSKTIKTH